LQLAEFPGFAAFIWGIPVSASRPQKKYRPGELAPITGIYRVTHGSRHRPAHDVVIIRGELLPACRTCFTNLTFEVVNAISHVTHDWDFSGPHNLVVRPLHEEFTDFRVFQRLNLRLPITVQLPPYAHPVVVRGFTCDLSAGGVGAIFREKLSSGHKTAVIQIAGKRGASPLCLNARFRHQSGLRYGFEFTRMAATEREAIRRLIENYRKAAAATGVA
jgi:hypothetical protein